MPRTKPVSTFTPRVRPSTQYSKPRDRSRVPVSFDSVEWTFDSTEITFDATFRDLGPLVSSYRTPRKIALLELENGLNFELEYGDILELEGGMKSNIIDSNWR